MIDTLALVPVIAISLVCGYAMCSLVHARQMRIMKEQTRRFRLDLQSIEDTLSDDIQDDFERECS